LFLKFYFIGGSASGWSCFRPGLLFALVMPLRSTSQAETTLSTIEKTISPTARIQHQLTGAFYDISHEFSPLLLL
jgi:hypothetical protein